MYQIGTSIYLNYSLIARWLKCFHIFTAAINKSNIITEICTCGNISEEYVFRRNCWIKMCLHFKFYCCLVTKSCSASLRPHGLLPARLLYVWDFPGKTGVGRYFLLQEIFSTQGLNLHLLHWQADSSSVSHLGSLILEAYRVAFKGPYWIHPVFTTSMLGY